MGTDVDADVSVDVNVPPNINLTTTADVDLASSSVIEVRPLSLHLDPLSTSLHVDPLSASLHVDPLQTSSKLDTDSSMTLDVRPLVVDVCAKLSIGALPRACIRMPYGHRFGFSLFGVEVIGLSFQGESRLIIDDLRKVPQVAWGGESEGEHEHQHPQVAWGGESEGEHQHQHEHHEQPSRVEKPVGPAAGRGGLRVRLD